MYISYERMAELVDAIVCQTIIPRMCGVESRYECNAPVCRCFFVPTFFTETEFLYALQSNSFLNFPHLCSFC